MVTYWCISGILEIQIGCCLPSIVICINPSFIMGICWASFLDRVPMLLVVSEPLAWWYTEYIPNVWSLHMSICHRLKIQDMELTRWFMHSCRKQLVGMQANQHGFSTKRGKQMIVMSFSDVTNIMLVHRVGGYIRRAHTSLKAVVLVFGVEHFGNLLRSHWPSVLATLVPLMEQEYIPTGKYSLFFICMCPRVSWTPLVSIV